MKIGTKSVLYGAHCFFIHPFFVAWAWCKLYGFPYDPRLWFAFFLHDIGYIGKPNLDGPEGELHPYAGAKIMGILFGKKWYDFTLYHSRHLAKRNGAQYSKLCVADKLAFWLTPSWLYMPMVKATGEVNEYFKNACDGKANPPKTLIEWHTRAITSTYLWALQYREIKPDTSTKLRNTTKNILEPETA